MTSANCGDETAANQIDSTVKANVSSFTSIRGFYSVSAAFEHLVVQIWSSVLIQRNTVLNSWFKTTGRKSSKVAGGTHTADVG